MLTPVLGNLDKKCWGREDELAWLMGRIASDDSSITLLHGDSGIGKSTLLKEFHERLRVQEMEALAAEDRLKDVAAGYWDCGRSLGVDPLLKCLDHCLRTRIPDELSLPQQLTGRIKQIFASLAEGSRLRTFLKALAVGFDQQYSGGTDLLLGQFVRPLFDVADIASHVSPLALPRVPADLFHEVLGFFQQAFDHCPMVLILDNLSALPESGQSLRLSSLWEILTTRMGDEEALPKMLHVVIAWKADPGNREELSRLEQELKRLRAYNRFEERRLEPIATPRMSEWLDAKFAWYRNASAAHRERVLQVAAGLPMVVKEGWIRDRIDSLDLEQLEKSAKSVCEDRFPGLTDTIEKAQGDWNTLFQLSIAPAILPPTALAVLADMHPQSAKIFLDRWSQMGLMEPAGVDQWRFDHERKQVHVRQVLAQKLLNRGREAARQLYDFYLQQCGFPDDSHPQAAAYPYFATQIAAYAGLPARQIESLTQALQSVGLWGETQSGVEDGNPRLLTPSFPWAVRFFIWHAALAKDGERLEIQEEGRELLGAVPVVLRHSNFAKALFNIINSDCRHARWERVEQNLERLRVLADRYEADEGVVLPFARALVNAGFALGSSRLWSKLEDTLSLMKEHADRHTDHNEVMLAYARFLVNAGLSYGSNQQMDALSRIYAELHAHAQKYSTNLDLWVVYANGLANAVGFLGRAGAWEPVAYNLTMLRALIDGEGNGEIVLSYANGLFNAVNSYTRHARWSQADETLDLLRTLADKCTNDAEVVRRYAEGLLNASLAYGSEARWPQMDQTLKCLRRLTDTHPDNSDLVVTYAKALLAAGASIQKASPTDGEQRLRDIELQLVPLKDRLPDHPDSHQIRALFEQIEQPAAEDESNEQSAPPLDPPATTE